MVVFSFYNCGIETFGLIFCFCCSLTMTDELAKGIVETVANWRRNSEMAIDVLIHETHEKRDETTDQIIYVYWCPIFSR